MTQPKARILIVDDETMICEALARLMKQEGLKTIVANEGFTALKMIKSEMPDVMLVDFRMPEMDGMQLMKLAKEVDPDLPIVMITGYADVPGAVEAMKAGAHDYMAKPFKNREVIRVVRRAISERELLRRLSNLSGLLESNMNLREMMGPSDAVSKIISDVNLVAKSNYTTIIQGETGTGKELVAHAIHTASSRAKFPYIQVDCGAIPPTLLESELFGHERGAFTGAVAKRQGKFEAAQKGTLLLDEISNMPLESQIKLLRVLQEKKIYRVGGVNPLSVDVRLLAATNSEIEDDVRRGTFRHDLYYRLNEFTIRIPALCKRKEDIVFLAKRFLDITNIELNKKVQGFTESALEAMLVYDWPGNVRQLKSTIRKAVLLADKVVTEKHLDILRGLHLNTMAAQTGAPQLPLREIIRRNTLLVERETLTQALRYAGGNKAKAARMLQIDYKTIHTKVKQFGINIDGVKNVQEE